MDNVEFELAKDRFDEMLEETYHNASLLGTDFSNTHVAMDKYNLSDDDVADMESIMNTISFRNLSDEFDGVEILCFGRGGATVAIAELEDFFDRRFNDNTLLPDTIAEIDYLVNLQNAVNEKVEEAIKTYDERLAEIIENNFSIDK